MKQKNAYVVSVDVGGGRNGRSRFAARRTMFFVEIQYNVSGVLCKKEITDTLSFRFNGGVSTEFIEQELPKFLVGAKFSTRVGEGAKPNAPSGDLYDFIIKEIRLRWREYGGWKKWRESKSQTCA